MKRKIVLITGGSSGLGRDMAKMAIDEGFEVIVTARRELELEKLKELAPERVRPVPGDIALPDTRRELKEEVEKKGQLDYLINNAGFGKGLKFENETLGSMQKMFDVNVLALMDLTRLLLPFLKKAEKGRVLNISSGFGVVPFPYLACYVATKYAVIGFSRSLNFELADSLVSVTAYCPSYTKTGFSDVAYEDSAFKDDLEKRLKMLLETSPKVARAIWRKKDSRKDVVFPTLISTASFWNQFIPHWIYKTILLALVRKYSK
jgi:short-subunit dehydrogenase